MFEKTKKFFIKWHLIEIFVFLLAIITGSYFTFINGTKDLKWYDWVIYVDIIVGILGAILLAKKNRYAWIVLTLDAMLYGSSFIGQGIIATGALNLFVVPVIIVASAFTWKNNLQEGNENHIKTKKLSLKEGIIIFIIIILGILLVGMNLNYFFGDTTSAHPWSAWVDASITIIMLFAFLFSTFRYREAWYLFLFSNVLKIIMFSILLSNFGKTENISPLSLILAVTYAINGIYALYLWKDSQKTEFFNKSK